MASLSLVGLEQRQRWSDSMLFLSLSAGLHDSLHESGESLRLPAPRRHAPQHRALLHGLVLRVSSGHVTHSSSCDAVALLVP